MAQLSQMESKSAERRKWRYFSEEFKRKKVEEIDKGISTVRQVTRTYQVSAVAVYKWIYKFSLMRKKGEKMVVKPRAIPLKSRLCKSE